MDIINIDSGGMGVLIIIIIVKTEARLRYPQKERLSFRPNIRSATENVSGEIS